MFGGHAPMLHRKIGGNEGGGPSPALDPPENVEPIEQNGGSGSGAGRPRACSYSKALRTLGIAQGDVLAAGLNLQTGTVPAREHAPRSVPSINVSTYDDDAHRPLSARGELGRRRSFIEATTSPTFSPQEVRDFQRSDSWDEEEFMRMRSGLADAAVAALQPAGTPATEKKAKDMLLKERKRLYRESKRKEKEDKKKKEKEEKKKRKEEKKKGQKKTSLSSKNGEWSIGDPIKVSFKHVCGIEHTQLKDLATEEANEYLANHGETTQKETQTPKGPPTKPPTPREEAPTRLGTPREAPPFWEIPFNEVELLNKIGQGGVALVYKGKWRGLEVAVKRLLNRDDEGLAKSFVSEIHLMSQLRHPNIINFLAGGCDPEPFFVVEFAMHGDLHDFVNKAKPTWSQKVQIARDVALAMLYLHSNHPPILHMDMKSLNVLIDRNHIAKVADFGLARSLLKLDATMTAPGSLRWLAPECFQTERYSKASDVYAYGLVLWEIVTGELPFTDVGSIRLIKALDTGTRPDIPKDLDHDYQGLMVACWDQAPEKRPPFSEVVERLNKICDATVHPL